MFILNILPKKILQLLLKYITAISYNRHVGILHLFCLTVTVRNNCSFEMTHAVVICGGLVAIKAADLKTGALTLVNVEENYTEIFDRPNRLTRMSRLHRDGWTDAGMTVFALLVWIRR